MASPYARAFESQERELDLDDLETVGAFPNWLDGVLLRTGPALFDLEHQALRHWFDGMAMLHRFAFDRGRVGYRCRFLASDAYEGARAEGEVQVKEWGTDPGRSLLEALAAQLAPPDLTDNGNIQILRYGDTVLATSETPLPLAFDPTTLATHGHADYADDLNGHIDPSHAHYDEQGHVWSYLLEFGLHSRLQVYRLDPTTMVREVICTLKSRTPSYIHSFGFTADHLVLVACPFVLDPLDLVVGDTALIEAYQWKPELGTVVHVVDRTTGAVTSHTTEPFFTFHHVNAFQEGEQLHVDLIRFDDPSVIQALYLDTLRSDGPTHGAGHLHRLTVDLADGGGVSDRRLSDKLVEMPCIPYARCNGRPYRYAYGAGTTVPGNWLDDLTKIDTHTGDALTWHRPYHYPGEPVFVGRPGATAEDDGLLLSVVLDREAERSYLLALDARDLTEVARALLPEVVPMAFHGIHLPA